MNEELLKAVARVAPEWMGAEFYTNASDISAVTFKGCPLCWTMDVGIHLFAFCAISNDEVAPATDNDNASAIIAMLDAMRKEYIKLRGEFNKTGANADRFFTVEKAMQMEWLELSADAVAYWFVEVFKK